MQYQALILDMDGTVLDSHEMVIVSMERLARENEITLTDRHYRMGLGCKAEDLMEDLGFADIRGAANRWREIMESMLDEITLFQGVEALLTAPIRRGVVTSQSRSELKKNIARLGLRDKFEFTVAVDDTPFCKPHPRPLLYCLERMGLTPAQALFVGDSHYDRECAAAAGVDFGLAVWGAQEPEAFPDAAYHFARPAEVLTYIRPVLQA